jgi:hypothetical protein
VADSRHRNGIAVNLNTTKPMTAKSAMKPPREPDQTKPSVSSATPAAANNRTAGLRPACTK